ncbi:MAG TPA: hypothetical protein VHQ41_02680 [Patescibacteria group bacterium]|nr:hypothetical protein [Patescibacteria group bacterium]
MKQKIILSLAGMFVAIMAMFAFAPSFATVSAQGTGSGCTTNCVGSGLNDIAQAFPARTTHTIPELAKLVINWALYLAAIIAVIFIIIGGFMYITSAGDSAKASKGRATLVNALIGLTMIVLSYLIVQIVYNFLTT